MITGQVGPDLKPRLSVGLAAASGTIHPVEFEIDTGFTSYVTLPGDLIRLLGLTQQGTSLATLADGQVVEFNIYIARASWHGQHRGAVVFESESEPLLGMAMLRGSKLTLEAQEGGEVTIEEIHPTVTEPDIPRR